MNKYVVFSLCVLVSVFAGVAMTIPTRIEIDVPELFGRGVGYGARAFGVEAYVIPIYWADYNERFLFAMWGARNGAGEWTGKIMQIRGASIESYPPYNCSDARAFCYAHQDKRNWRGWIEFRGHRRPMCGGERIEQKCLIIGDT